MNFFLPCLLERWGRDADGRALRVAKSTWEDVRRDVLRNLEWLLNTEAPYRVGVVELPASVQSSVLCFGVPAYSGRAQSTMVPDRIADDIRRRILAFEPRIHADTIEVRPLNSEDRHRFNTLQFSVHGYLRANPLQEFEVRTEIDLETGQARLMD